MRLTYNLCHSYKLLIHLIYRPVLDGVSDLIFRCVLNEYMFSICVQFFPSKYTSDRVSVDCLTCSLQLIPLVPYFSKLFSCHTGLYSSRNMSMYMCAKILICYGQHSIYYFIFDMMIYRCNMCRKRMKLQVHISEHACGFRSCFNSCWNVVPYHVIFYVLFYVQFSYLFLSFSPYSLLCFMVSFVFSFLCSRQINYFVLCPVSVKVQRSGKAQLVKASRYLTETSKVYAISDPDNCMVARVY